VPHAFETEAWHHRLNCCVQKGATQGPIQNGGREESEGSCARRKPVYCTAPRPLCSAQLRAVHEVNVWCGGNGTQSIPQSSSSADVRGEGSERLRFNPRSKIKLARSHAPMTFWCVRKRESFVRRVNFAVPSRSATGERLDRYSNREVLPRSVDAFQFWLKSGNNSNQFVFKPSCVCACGNGEQVRKSRGNFLNKLSK
jgi:hypothetical protein